MPTETVPETTDIDTAVARPGDTLGYARVSTADQSLEAQRSRLCDAGAIRIFTDVASGKRSERPGLAELIDHARPGDRLCVTRLDRLGRSLRELLETVDGLKARGIHIIALLVVVATSTAQSFEDCSTYELKADALSAFLERHYELGFSWIVQARVEDYEWIDDEDPELMGAIFSTMGEQEETCQGNVRINDDCDITTVGGLSLKYARERESAFKCEG